MSKLSEIPVVVKSGSKYYTSQGISAIKDGIKKNHNNSKKLKKPQWLRIVNSNNPIYYQIKDEVIKHNLATVCEEAKCPNIGECWSHGTATIMLMGKICTRACRFCAVDTGNPRGFLDKNEPLKVAATVDYMRLNYVVLTSVNRDDLIDGGAQHYANTIQAIKKRRPSIKVEALTPDFQGQEKNIAILLESELDVFAQNVETVERLTHEVRDNRAGYWQTLHVLRYAKQYRPGILTKTSLMLGLGETDQEIFTTMQELRAQQVDILTLGQYLQPTDNHLPVVKYVTPAEFINWRKVGLEMGFFEVAAGPLVRSSYRAERVFNKNNLGLSKHAIINGITDQQPGSECSSFENGSMPLTAKDKE